MTKALTIFILFISIAFNVVCTLWIKSQHNNEAQYTLGTMPRLPFEVEYNEYGKTVKVLPGCDKNQKTIVLKFDATEKNIGDTVYAAVDKAFDKPGITEIRICRN